MRKQYHEIRDPVHDFVTVENHERDLINTRPFQRLRHIHQLGMSHFVYPGATHTRFEHSLGVMELATRVYDRICSVGDYPAAIGDALPELQDSRQREYWRSVLRAAALCHDLGHLPFSHVAEGMLPDGVDHEAMTVRIIRCPELEAIWSDSRLSPTDVAKIAVGPSKLGDQFGRFTSFESIVAEIVVGDAFGVDRMDYLLRDSLHAGVAYGRFDHHRLVNTLRIMTPPRERSGKHASREPILGVEEGGIYAAEALMLARYFMFSQVYYHHVRRAYDHHLVEFLRSWLPGGQFPGDVDGYLAFTDNRVMAALEHAGADPSRPGHEHAVRIAQRTHFRRVFWPSLQEIDHPTINPAAVIGRALAEKFGADRVWWDAVPPKDGALNFPVMHGEQSVSSIAVSKTVQQIPAIRTDNVYVAPELREKAGNWLKRNRKQIMDRERSAW